jgi:hypothetical protein
VEQRLPPCRHTLPPGRHNKHKGWLSWADWLGYGEGQPKSNEFLPFEEAREIVRTVGLKSQKQWMEWSRDCRPAYIPSRPDSTFADEGWLSWADWLGYGEGGPPSNKFLPFEEARKIVRAVGLKSQKQWMEWSRDCRPADIPSAPHRTYKDEGWVSMADWLGYGVGRAAYERTPKSS